LACKGLICHAVFAAKMALAGKIKKIAVPPGITGKFVAARETGGGAA
jgi:hypothetical protein